MHVDIRAPKIPMPQPVLNFVGGVAALGEMRSAGVLERMHVCFLAWDSGEIAILLH
jgi:hypothetical protein